MANGGEDFICQTCRQIDFNRPFEDPQPGSRDQVFYDTWHDKGMFLHNMRYNDDCALCKIMFRGMDSPDSDEEYELRSYIVRGSPDDDDHQPNYNTDSISLKWRRPKDDLYLSLPTEDIFCHPSRNISVQGAFVAQPVKDIWDHNKAKSWLTACAAWHNSTCNGQKIPRVPGMNLIDCEEMTIVKADDRMKWMALSYVWGADYQNSTSPDTKGTGFREGSLVPPDLPRTIQDAIRVTLQLEYRYLWVDEYCIDQTDEHHLKSQIKKMDQIYRGSDLTIVAAAGEDKGYGLPGVRYSGSAGPTKREGNKIIFVGDFVIFSNGDRPDTLTFRSKWYTRAW